MQINKIITFFLVVTLISMTLLSIGTLIDSCNMYEKIEMQDKQIEIAKKENDKLKLLLSAEIEKNTTEEESDYIAISRHLINAYDLTSPSGISISTFDKILTNTGMSGLGASIFESEHTYEINGIFIIAVAQLESGYGTSTLAVKKNNLFSMNAWGDTDYEIFHRAFRYDTKHDSVMDFAKVIRNNYFAKGRTDIRSISVVYCELPKPWESSVEILMNNILEKLKQMED